MDFSGDLVNMILLLIGWTTCVERGWFVIAFKLSLNGY